MTEDQRETMKDIFGESIFVYTSQDAISDGILFDITKINPAWRKGLINIVTTNLLNKGYIDEDDTVNVPNLIDLLNQSLKIIERDSKKNNGLLDWFYSGSVELPSGRKQKIFICQNETGSNNMPKYTIMLPEDY